MTAALEIQDLDPGEKFLLVVLGSYANTDNTLWPSQATLSHDTCMGERTVRRHLASLETRLLIERKHRGRGDRRTSDMITLLYLPAKLAAILPAKNDRPTGQKRPKHAANLAGKPVIEPIIEPSRGRSRDGHAPAQISAEERAAVGIMFKDLAAQMRGNRA